MTERRVLPATVQIQRLSPAGTVLESRTVPFLGFYGNAQRYAHVGFGADGSISRTFAMLESGQGTGRFGHAGWRLHPISFGQLQSLRNPRAIL